MANLKLIKVTGKPFSDAFIGKIGIQRSNYQFDIIREGRLYSQKASYGNGWEYATAKEIKENWAAIYPHWTPEVGDNVIVTQDYCGWVNCKGTIIAKDDTSDYYRVESETGRSCVFDYTSQMILAPYSKSIVEPTIGPEETATTKFKIDDRVKCIGIPARGYGKVGTVRQIGGSVGVEFDENVDGHTLDGCCKDGHGWWVGSPGLELVTESKPKEEFVNVRFLTKQEFKDKSLWRDTYPKGWNPDGHMNKYLGQSLVIPKSNIGSGGTLVYEDWTFKVTDYIVITLQDVADGTLTPAITPTITPTFSGHVDPLSLYKQKPITIKQKPKSKLTII